MEVYLESLQETIRKTIIEEQNKKFEITHNHPPVRNLVHGCEYCQKYGNCFMKKQ